MSKEEIIKDFINSENFTIIDEYISKPYEETIIEQDKEIERLNNIINELEEFLIQLNKKIKDITNVPFDVKEIMEELDKIKELKGVDKE